MKKIRFFKNQKETKAEQARDRALRTPKQNWTDTIKLIKWVYSEELKSPMVKKIVFSDDSLKKKVHSA